MVEKNNLKDSSVNIRRRSSVTNRMNRHESITRGTASSIAKMVRPNQQEPENDDPHTQQNHQTNNISRKKKRNSTISTMKKPSTDDSRRKSWCPPPPVPVLEHSLSPTTKKRNNIRKQSSPSLSGGSGDSSNVNQYHHTTTSDRFKNKRDSIDSLTTSTTASSHEEDYIPKPSRSSVLLKPKIKPFKEEDAPAQHPLDITTPECKQKEGCDSILKKHKYQNDFHDAPETSPHCITNDIHKSCLNKVEVQKPSLSNTTSQLKTSSSSSGDDDLPITPVDYRSHSPCSPVPHSFLPDYDHQIEKIEKAIQKEEEEEQSKKRIKQILKPSIPVIMANPVLSNQPELTIDSGYTKTPPYHVSEPAATTYSTTSPIIHISKRRTSELEAQEETETIVEDVVDVNLSKQLWKELNVTEDNNSNKGDEWIGTRLKWNLGQWLGTLVGTGAIRDKDYDDYGHPKNVIISGLCVTTEPGLLPKRLLRFYKREKQLVHHSYVLEVNRQKRLDHFKMINEKDWVPDAQVSTCQFTQQGKPCTVEFGFFNRKHHCRSCGHIFCQSHSANRLALFKSDDTGEWVRVCDTCLYSRVKPFLRKGNL